MAEDTSKRRRAPRYSCSGTVEMFQSGKLTGWGTVSEIGRGGCYIETGQPLPVGSKAQLRLSLEHATLEIGAEVVWMTPQVGMGMRFDVASPAIELAVVHILSMVAGDGHMLDGGDSHYVPPAEFLIPEIANEEINPEAAPEILARIIERVNKIGTLTQEELMEIVKTGQ
jgi:PilZ domain-containing protein